MRECCPAAWAYAWLQQQQQGEATTTLERTTTATVGAIVISMEKELSSGSWRRRVRVSGVGNYDDALHADKLFGGAFDMDCCRSAERT